MVGNYEENHALFVAAISISQQVLRGTVPGKGFEQLMGNHSDVGWSVTATWTRRRRSCDRITKTNSTRKKTVGTTKKSEETRSFARRICPLHLAFQTTKPASPPWQNVSSSTYRVDPGTVNEDGRDPKILGGFRIRFCLRQGALSNPLASAVPTTSSTVTCFRIEADGIVG